jgi:hypothetical protein
MKASDIYASPFLKGADIQKPIQLTIHDMEIGEFTDQKTGKEEKRVIVGFTGARKRLVLNKTQAQTLIAAFGDEMAGWIGRRVILSPGQAPNGQATIVLAAVPEDPEADAAADVSLLSVTADGSARLTPTAPASMVMTKCRCLQS